MVNFRRIFVHTLNDAFVAFTLLETAIWLSCFVSDIFFVTHDTFDETSTNSTTNSTSTIDIDESATAVCVIGNTICSSIKCFILPLLWYNIFVRVNVRVLNIWFGLSIIVDIIVFGIDLGIGLKNMDYGVIPQLMFFIAFRVYIYWVMSGLIKDMGGTQADDFFPTKGTCGLYYHYKEELQSLISILLITQIILDAYQAILVAVYHVEHSSCAGTIPRITVMLETEHLLALIFCALGLFFFRYEWRRALKVWAYICGLGIPLVFLVEVFETRSVLRFYPASKYLFANILTIFLNYIEFCFMMIGEIALVWGIFRYLDRTAPGGVRRLEA